MMTGSKSRLFQTLAVKCVVILGILMRVHCGVSSKMDFPNEEDSLVVYTTNSSKPDEDDVEVKHTIVVSTKLKNNNRRGGIYGSSDDGVLTYNIGGQGLTASKADSGEVPIVMGHKAVDSTQIRTPDSRTRNKVYPESVFINRNVRDEYDVFPEIALNAGQWKPSTFFNNINWLNTDTNRDNYNFVRRSDEPFYQNQGRIHRKITEDGQREFYCRKCREMSQAQGRNRCGERRSNSNSWLYQTTTPKVKIDGKLAKLN